MANAFVHVELSTTDLAKAKDFYGKLFEWKLEDVPMGDDTYTMIKPVAGTGGGMMKNPVPGTPSFWLAYVEVADIHAATKQALRQSRAGAPPRPSVSCPRRGRRGRSVSCPRLGRRGRYRKSFKNTR